MPFLCKKTFFIFMRLENIRLTAYIACFLNVLCIPALWFFVRRQFDKSFRITLLRSLHLVPAVVSSAVYIICYSPMTLEQISEIQRFMEAGGEDFPALVNDIVIATQLFVYFPLMLRYIHPIAINGYLHKNFFDLINEMRVEEAKRLLLLLEDNRTVESVHPECGFSSGRSFFRTFKKFEGITPAQWLRNNSFLIS
jgi:AraC-like DNA-binding protein